MLVRQRLHSKRLVPLCCRLGRRPRVERRRVRRDAHVPGEHAREDIILRARKHVREPRLDAVGEVDEGTAARLDVPIRRKVDTCLHANGNVRPCVPAGMDWSCVGRCMQRALQSAVRTLADMVKERQLKARVSSGKVKTAFLSSAVLSVWTHRSRALRLTHSCHIAARRLSS